MLISSRRGRLAGLTLLAALMAGCPNPLNIDTRGEAETRRSSGQLGSQPNGPLSSRPPGAPPVLPSDAAAILASPGGLKDNAGGLKGVALLPTSQAFEAEGPTLVEEAPTGLLGSGFTASALAPVVGKSLRLTGQGAQILFPRPTNDDGSFESGDLGPTKGDLMRLEVSLESQKLVSLVPTPRDAGTLTVPLDPATTMIAQKLVSNAPTLAGIPPALPEKLAVRLRQSMSMRAAVAAVALSAARVAGIFDQMLREDPKLAAELRAIAKAEGAEALLDKTVPSPIPGG